MRNIKEVLSCLCLEMYIFHGYCLETKPNISNNNNLPLGINNIQLLLQHLNTMEYKLSKSILIPFHNARFGLIPAVTIFQFIQVLHFRPCSSLKK